MPKACRVGRLKEDAIKSSLCKLFGVSTQPESIESDLKFQRNKSYNRTMNLFHLNWKRHQCRALHAARQLDHMFQAFGTSVF